MAVAPHQIYGPLDNLFLPNLLETAGNGRLCIFGTGRSIIIVCFNDNYCHGLMCGADACTPNSKASDSFTLSQTASLRTSGPACDPSGSRLSTAGACWLLVARYPTSELVSCVVALAVNGLSVIRTLPL